MSNDSSVIMDLTMLYWPDIQCILLDDVNAEYRGAKVALYLTLTKPDISRAVISVENAPISAKLSSTFKQYVEAMKAITDAKLTKRNEAEQILARYEGVLPTIVKN